MLDLDKPAYHIGKMQSLLSDRHPGLSTWMSALDHHWEAVAGIWSGSGHSWSEDWPTEPGYYWFYGKPCHAMEKRVYLAKVDSTISSFGEEIVTVSYNGEDSYFVDGYWMPARVPGPPKEVNDG